MNTARNAFHHLWLGLLFLLTASTIPGCAQEFSPEEVVFPITTFGPDIKSLSPVSLKFGTGFCLDPDCRFVGTNCHVAELMGKFVRIKGVFSAHRYLDSSANDAGAQDIPLLGGGRSLKFNPAHDLAIYEMRRPLKRFHGVGFELERIESGDEADIYAFPFNGNPKRGLVRWHAKCIGNTGDGLLAFRYEEGQVRGGASGGIIVDRTSKKIVGVLSTAREDDRVAFAVPVREIADFVTRAQPICKRRSFPKRFSSLPFPKTCFRPMPGLAPPVSCTGKTIRTK